MDLKDLKESDDAQVFPHLRWACFNPPVLGMFQFFPASLALLLLPFRQTFDNVTPKLQTRDIGESFIALDRPEVQKKSLPGNITLLLLISSKVMLSGNNFFSVDNNEKDRRNLQKIMQKLSSNEEHFHLFQDFILKVTATFLILTAISELPY